MCSQDTGVQRKSDEQRVNRLAKRATFESLLTGRIFDGRRGSDG
jgi:hypothetical protein